MWGVSENVAMQSSDLKPQNATRIPRVNGASLAGLLAGAKTKYVAGPPSLAGETRKPKPLTF